MICRECQQVSTSDHTPMAEISVCMWCRPEVEVVCARCEARCPGTHDGMLRCPACRAGQLGAQQYEDKQRTLYERLVAEKVITSTGESLIPLAALEQRATELNQHLIPRIYWPLSRSVP
jgi:hypothetical protein